MSARLLKDPATVSSRIFVGHLQTDDMTKHELEEHFSKYGTIMGSLINRGFGFVQFEEEQSAQKAIQNEDGAMFKGRRIDVRPAKKDNQSSGGSGNSGGGGPNVGGNVGKPMGGPNNQFNSGGSHFKTGNDSFNSSNQSFSGANQSFNANQSFGCDTQFPDNQKGNNSIQNRGGGSDQFSDGNQNRDNAGDQFGVGNQNRNNGNDQFNNSMQNKAGNQFTPGNQNRNNNEQFAGGAGNQNRGGNQFGAGGNQNRQGGNQNRNANNQNNSQNQSGGGGINSGGGGRARAPRGGKNRNRSRDNSGGNNFRDRSPLGRTGRVDDKGTRDWDHKQGDRLRSNNFGRDSFNDSSSSRYDNFKSSGSRDGNMSFNSSTSGSGDYTGGSAEKNDCEIIVVNKALTREYAEAIELRLKKIGLMVDLLFPNEDVLLSRVLGNIASRGCLYAIVITPINQEHHSLTLNILHGLPQEHRNMPVDDAVNLMSRDFANYKAGGRSVPLNTPFANERHPDAIQVLLNMLADNHQLTVLQYDRVLKYLEIKREEQVQVELGDVKDLPTTTTLTVSDSKQAELQSRILNILNSNKTSPSVPAPSPVPAPTPAPAPVPPANWGIASTTALSASTTTTTTGVSPSPLLNDPTVQKALDSLLQGNLLKSIGDQQPATTTTPLFAAFPNIGRF